jgi:hypothetical protein
LYHLYLISFFGFEFWSLSHGVLFLSPKAQVEDSNSIYSTLLPINSWFLIGVQPITCELYPASINLFSFFILGQSKTRVPSTMDEFELLNRVFPQIHRLESTLYTSMGFLEEKLLKKSSPKPQLASSMHSQMTRM